MTSGVLRGVDSRAWNAQRLTVHLRSSGVVPSYAVAAISFTLAIWSYGGSLGHQESSLHGCVVTVGSEVK